MVNVINERQYHALGLRQTDTTGAIHRLCENEQLYSSCLRTFLEDPTVKEINTAIANACWDEAFTAAHALKGLAGNMGFVPLMHSTGQLIVLIRRGQTSEIHTSLEQVNSAYRDIVDGIHQYFDYADKEQKGESNENHE